MECVVIYMAASSGGMDNEEENAHQVADVNVLRSHILQLVPVLLEDDRAIPSTLNAKLDEPSTIDLLKKFLGDPQAKSLMIERLTTKGDNFLGVL